MNKFYSILSSFIIAFSAMGMAADYTEPSYTCDKYDSGDKQGQDKVFEDFTDSYVETITLTKGSITKEWQHNGTRTFWNVLDDLTMNAKAGETISAHFVAHSLGEYDESTIKQDLRFTAVVLSIDWDGDGTFEFAEKIVGNTPPTHYIGGNMDVLDYTYDLEVPKEAKIGTTARVRFNYTNAWFGNKTANDFINTCKEGIVYDFNIKIIPNIVESFAITITPNENADIVVKNGEYEVWSGDPVAEGTELTVEATPHQGYRLVSIMAGEEDITSTKTFTVKGKTTITVTVEKVESVTVSYTITGDKEYIEKVELYDAEDNLIQSGSKIEKGSKYTIRIYKDKTAKMSVTLNENELDLMYDEELKAYYYSETADADQTFVIEVTKESSIETVKVSEFYYNSAEQVLYANGKVTVYDMTGRVVLVNEGNTSVAHLADGIYTAVVNGKAVKFNK